MKGYCENYKKRKEHLKVIELLKVLSRQSLSRSINLTLYSDFFLLFTFSSFENVQQTFFDERRKKRETLFYQK